MSNSLRFIQQKCNDIQIGLLRLHEKKGIVTFHVKLTHNNDGLVHCIVTDSEISKRLLNKNVNLVQKKHDDYLYMSGKVSDESVNDARILSIRILKACWFEKKSKGTLSWLKEKYLYESEELSRAIA